MVQVLISNTARFVFVKSINISDCGRISLILLKTNIAIICQIMAYISSIRLDRICDFGKMRVVSFLSEVIIELLEI